MDHNQNNTDLQAAIQDALMQRTKRNFATASMILGILSIILLCCGAIFLSALSALLSFIFAFCARHNGYFEKNALVGLIFFHHLRRFNPYASFAAHIGD